jgi:hypothetical protein
LFAIGIQFGYANFASEPNVGSIAAERQGLDAVAGPHALKDLVDEVANIIDFNGIVRALDRLKRQIVSPIRINEAEVKFGHITALQLSY